MNTYKLMLLTSGVALMVACGNPATDDNTSAFSNSAVIVEDSSVDAPLELGETTEFDVEMRDLAQDTLNTYNATVQMTLVDVVRGDDTEHIMAEQTTRSVPDPYPYDATDLMQWVGLQFHFEVIDFDNQGNDNIHFRFNQQRYVAIDGTFIDPMYSVFTSHTDKTFLDTGDTHTGWFFVQVPPDSPFVFRYGNPDRDAEPVFFNVE